VRQRGRVEHDGSEPTVRGAAQQRFVGDVVEVQRNGDDCRLGERGVAQAIGASRPPWNRAAFSLI
jgi:hypothetical protein